MFKNLMLVALMLFAWPLMAVADELSGYQMPSDQLVIQAMPTMDAWPDGDGADHVARSITVTGENTQPVNYKVTSPYVEYVLEVIAMSTDKSLPLEVGWRSHPDI